MNVQALIDRAGGVTKLAQLLGVSHSTICEWNRNGYVPGTRVASICAALRIGPEWILPLVRPPVGAKVNGAKSRSRRGAVA